MYLVHYYNEQFKCFINTKYDFNKDGEFSYFMPCLFEFTDTGRPLITQKQYREC